LTRAKLRDIRSHVDDIPGQFVAEHRWRNDHPCVIAAAKYLHIRAAGQGGSYAYQNVSLAKHRDGYRFNL
jgi:hypothetical protein